MNELALLERTRGGIQEHSPRSLGRDQASRPFIVIAVAEISVEGSPPTIGGERRSITVRILRGGFGSGRILSCGGGRRRGGRVRLSKRRGTPDREKQTAEAGGETPPNNAMLRELGEQ